MVNASIDPFLVMDRPQSQSSRSHHNNIISEDKGQAIPSKKIIVTGSNVSIDFILSILNVE